VIRGPYGSVFVSAVCDGAGSAAHSEAGARMASATIVGMVEDHFRAGGKISDIDRRVAEHWVLQTAEAVRALARVNAHAEREYASTLLMAIVGTRSAVFVQIGDGAIVVSHGRDDGWSWVFWPLHGEYANQTTFLLSADAIDRMEFEYASRRIDALALFSDGIERMVLHTQTKTVNDAFFDQMMGPVLASPGTGLDRQLSDALGAYLGSAVVDSRTSDDKTLVLATRRARPRTEQRA